MTHRRQTAAPAHQNAVLAALRTEMQDALRPFLGRTTLKARQVLYGAADHIARVYFPESAVLMYVTAMADGRTIGCGSVGRDGAAGLPSVFGASAPPCELLTAVQGTCLTIDSDALARAASAHPELRDVLLFHSHGELLRSVRVTACNGLHSVRQRCARWVLTTLDTLGTDRFAITHDFLAYLLGMTRPTLSTALEAFHAARIIDVRRREIVVLDRAALESASCECYSVIRTRLASAAALSN